MIPNAVSPVRPLPARLRRAGVAAVLLVLAPGVARAQLTPPSTSRVGPAVSAPATKDLGKEAPPPALPGAEPATEGMIPAEKGAADLPPTEALFDSIHRGDVASARDALNRGADLEGRNVLGQSPLDLSIDLNRNDITFLLLSMRGPGGGERGPPSRAEGLRASARGARPGEAPEADAAPARGRSVREARGRGARGGAAPQDAEPGEALVASGPRPVLFANDGGTARPAVGFLGFPPR